MKNIQALLYKFLKFIRYFLQFPLIILNFIGNMYADLLLFIDRRNHSAKFLLTCEGTTQLLDGTLSAKVKQSKTQY